jgi:hypothetical protein
MDISTTLTIDFGIEPEDVGDAKYLLADILREYATMIDDNDVDLSREVLEISNGTITVDVVIRPGGQGWRKTTRR